MRTVTIGSIVSITVALLACGVLNLDSTVSLINRYQLKRVGGDVIHLTAPDGKVVSSESISQFCVSGDLLYGWIDGREAYFLLDTKSNKFQQFSNAKDLNLKLLQRGISPLKMSNSYTFWDIKSGHKTPSW